MREVGFRSHRAGREADGGARRGAATHRSERPFQRCNDAASGDVPPAWCTADLGRAPPASDATFQEQRPGAHTALDAVTRFPGVMAAHGMRATFAADLAAELALYDAAVAEMERGHLEPARVTSTIRQALAEGMRLLEVFDAINRHRFAGQPELLAEWESARNVAWERGGKWEEEETPADDAGAGS